MNHTCAGASRPRSRNLLPIMALAVLLFSLAGSARAQTIQPFFAPAQPSGSMTVRLHPMENVTPGTARLVTFGVPFPRGSLSPAGLSTVRVLRNGSEVPAFVEMLTPWRHLTNSGHDGQSVRIARLQIEHTFAVSYPGNELITVQWGGPPRTLNRVLTDPLLGWHNVISGTFVEADGVREPDVYALLPKAVLAQGALSLRQVQPFSDSIPEQRDDPAAMDAVAHWPGYEEADRALKNNFYTSVNQDDPRVIAFGDGRLNDYKNQSEPWLYDRSTTFFRLYEKTGFLAPLREAVRSTQFYRANLHGPTVSPPSLAGLFRLKQPIPANVTGGNDAMYSYAECFAYDHWLTGNPLSVEPIRWVAATHTAQTEPSRWAPGAGAWTERHTAFALLANLVAFEMTGETVYRQAVLTQSGDFIWHQNGAGGLLPANRIDGGLYHYGGQHGDGEEDELIASPWMTALLMDAMVRVYGVSEDPAIANFVVRAARFQAGATHLDDEHSLDTAGAALRYPHYVTRFDGAPDVLDGYDGTAIDHALEVSATIAWGAYFHHVLQGGPDAAIEAAARDLYHSFDESVNHWIRPTAPAPPNRLTAYRVVPWRKYAWEHRPSASLSWVMNQIDNVSPPPLVAITSPQDLSQFTAPANILIQATATTAAGAIERVEFFAGSTLLGEDTTPPYSYQWNGAIANLTGYTLTARATTSQGVVGTSPGVVIEVVSPTHPALTITAPADGANFVAPANVTVTATAVPEGATTIARVVFLREGVELFTDTQAPYSLSLPNLVAGNQEIEVRAFDSNGGYSLDFVTFTVTTPTPPNVSLTAPAAGATTAGGAVLALAANASAPGSAVTRVTFLVDGVPVFDDATAPYAYDYNVPQNWAAGAHTIAARVLETNGGTATSAINIQALALSPLTVAFDTPANNATFNIGANVALQATANAPGSTVTRVEFFANGTFLGEDQTAPYTAGYTAQAGQVSLLARAFDALGRSAEASRTIQVNGVVSPTVALTAPVPGAVLVTPATPTLTADASIVSGSIARVRFYDGDTLLGEDTSAPYALTAGALTVGAHTFTAVAIATGTGQATTSAPVTVVVGAPDTTVVAVTSPRNGETNVGTFPQVRFTAAAGHTGSGSIQRVEFWLDNALLATDTTAPYEYDWATVYGFHQVYARAYPATGAPVNSSTVVFEYMQPPAVAVSSPTAGTRVRPGAATTVTAAVTPGTAAVTEVRFYANGTLIDTDTTTPYAATWTPTATGNVALTARVFDLRGFERVSDSVAVNVNYSPREAWRFAQFGTYHNSGGAADDADPDGDRRANLLEWMLGSNPNAAEAANPVLAVSGASSITLAFPHLDDAEALLFAQWSTDFVTWHDVPIGSASSGPDANGVSVSVVQNSGALDAIVVTIPRGLAPGGRIFTRLRGVGGP